jgi:hypothetical protein
VISRLDGGFSPRPSEWRALWMTTACAVAGSWSEPMAHVDHAAAGDGHRQDASVHTALERESVREHEEVEIARRCRCERVEAVLEGATGSVGVVVEDGGALGLCQAPRRLTQSCAHRCGAQGRVHADPVARGPRRFARLAGVRRRGARQNDRCHIPEPGVPFASLHDALPGGVARLSSRARLSEKFGGGSLRVFGGVLAVSWLLVERS